MSARRMGICKVPGEMAGGIKSLTTPWPAGIAHGLANQIELKPAMIGANLEWHSAGQNRPRRSNVGATPEPWPGAERLGQG